MNASATHNDLDLTVSRIIKAPRAAVWDAWADPASLARWWVPEPEVCRVLDLELHPGGSFRTELRLPDGSFGPHITGCFLAVDPQERLVFTDALVAGWRPAESAFVTSIITMADHPEGTEYTATAMHRSAADRDRHLELGFHDGWGTVVAQLAQHVESRRPAEGRA